MKDESGPKAAPARTPTVDDPIDAGKLARWLELAEFALDNDLERIDALVQLCDSLETAWLAACAQVTA